MKEKLNKLVIFVDGGARGNPGPAGLGVVICQKNQVLKEYFQYLGERTNNEAEYEAVIFALKKVKALFGKKRIKNLSLEILSDSELLVNQLSGRYKILDEKIQKLFITVWNLRIDFQEVVFKLIKREENQRADKLVNEAINNATRTQKLSI
jgi:ribonuclease HI